MHDTIIEELVWLASPSEPASYISGTLTEGPRPGGAAGPLLRESPPARLYPMRGTCTPYGALVPHAGHLPRANRASIITAGLLGISWCAETLAEQAASRPDEKRPTLFSAGSWR